MEMRDPLATSAARRRVREAAFKRAYALSLRQHGATQAQIAAALALSSTRVGQILAKAEQLAARPRWHGQFPARALNFLIMRDLAGKPEIEAAQALARLTRKELKEAPGLGKDAIAALAAWLERLGLTLRGEIPVETKKGVPGPGRPCDSHSPLRAGRKAPSTCDMPRNAP
jgi:hypothetical protein